MSSHAVMLRRGHTTIHGQPGLSCKELYLDQVYIVFRPTNQITANEFIAPDSSSYNWHVETDHLLVTTEPGFRYPLYSVGASTEDHQTTAYNPVSLASYSCALSVTPGTEGGDDYWCRTYRPIRDMPIAVDLHDTNEIRIQLLFPLILDNSINPTLRQIPDYRILRVLCEFSTKEED